MKWIIINRVIGKEFKVACYRSGDLKVPYFDTPYSGQVYAIYVYVRFALVAVCVGV